MLAKPYHVRVLVPCYREGLPILRATVEGALAAHLPKVGFAVKLAGAAC